MQSMGPWDSETGPSERAPRSRRLTFTLVAVTAAFLVAVLIWAAIPVASPPPHVPDLPEVRAKAGPATSLSTEMADRLGTTPTLVTAHNDACESASSKDFELWHEPDPHYTCEVTQYRALQGGDDIVAGIRAWHAQALTLGCSISGDDIDSYLADYYPPHGTGTPQDEGATAMPNLRYRCPGDIEVGLKPLDPAHAEWTGYGDGWYVQTRMGTIDYPEDLNREQNGGCTHPYDCLELQTPSTAEIERDLRAYQGKLILIMTVRATYHTS